MTREVQSERFRKAWEEDREGMLARLEAARAKAAAERQERSAEEEAKAVAAQAEMYAYCDEVCARPLRHYYERRCVHCGAFFRGDTRDALDAISAERHGAGLCVKEERAAQRRSDAQEVRRIKHSPRLAHTAAVLGVSIVPDADSEGREEE